MTRLWLGSLIGFLAPALGFCAEPNRSWDTLMQSLEPGKTVVVTRMSSAQLEGKLLGISAESITVRWHGEPQVVPRDDVYRVRIANIRRRNTLTGMALGGAAGAIGGAASTGSGGAAVLFGGIWAGIGAAAGGVIPIGKPLYQVAGPKPRAARATAKE